MGLACTAQSEGVEAVQASITMFSAALILAVMTAVDAKVGTPIHAVP